MAILIDFAHFDVHPALDSPLSHLLLSTRDFGHHPMKAFVGITDRDWFDLLSRRPQLDEVNFWQTSNLSTCQASTHPSFISPVAKRIHHQPNNIISWD
ncbi:MAG: hypothetical protein PHI39_02610 [Kiritimatiellae bacterium]|nr:hypothetical protein [Kiritimatiellia bacterium]